MSSLQYLAYRAIPAKTYHSIKKDATKIKEQSVLLSVKNFFTEYHKKPSDWIESTKIDSEIKELLTIFNHFTNKHFFIALNKIYLRTIPDDNKTNTNYFFNHHLDYLREILLFLHDKNLFDETIDEHEQENNWSKEHFIVMEVFNILCYIRLQNKDDFDITYMYSKNQLKSINELKQKFKDNDALPIFLYHFVKNTNFNLDNYQSYDDNEDNDNDDDSDEDE